LAVWLKCSSADIEIAQHDVGGGTLEEVRCRHSLDFSSPSIQLKLLLPAQTSRVCDFLNTLVEDNTQQSNSTVIPKDGITNNNPAVQAAEITQKV